MKSEQGEHGSGGKRARARARDRRMREFPGTHVTYDRMTHTIEKYQPGNSGW